MCVALLFFYISFNVSMEFIEYALYCVAFALFSCNPVIDMIRNDIFS